MRHLRLSWMAGMVCVALIAALALAGAQAGKQTERKGKAPEADKQVERRRKHPDTERQVERKGKVIEADKQTEREGRVSRGRWARSSVPVDGPSQR